MTERELFERWHKTKHADIWDDLKNLEHEDMEDVLNEIINDDFEIFQAARQPLLERIAELEEQVDQLKFEWDESVKRSDEHFAAKERAESKVELLQRINDYLYDKVMQWQPIETAPKDEAIWCFSPHSCGGFQYPAILTNDGEGGEHWVNTIDNCPENPTHWMPLPPAPRSEK